MKFSYVFQAWCVSRKRNTPYRREREREEKKVYDIEITYSKLKSGPVTLLQGRPMITGKHMPGAEYLVVGVFF